MRRYLQPALFMILVGLVVGGVAAATVIKTEPAILGWALGLGLGLMGGALLAAITSGDQIVSGPAPRRGTVASAPWLDAQDADTPDSELSADESDESSAHRRTP